KWAKTPCFYIIKASKKSIIMTGATSEFEDEIKKLNDYIKIPGYRRALPVRRFKEDLLIRPCILKRIICARNVFRRLFTKDFPKENPRSFKDGRYTELAFGWDIEDFKNDMVQSSDKIINEWKILKEGRKTLRLEEKNNCKPSKIEQKIVEQEVQGY
ncbi:679_t:CDS:2, partial [Scutellospora calospora]